MADGKNPRPSQDLERWERELVKAIAATIRTTERADLESVLALHLWQTKQRFGSVAEKWRGLAATVLRNKAANWIRDRQLYESRLTSLDRSPREGETLPPLMDTLRSHGTDADVELALQRVWDELDEVLRRAWALLVEETGNQTRVASRLGVHRNTVRVWVRKIREALERHGFSG